MIRLFHQAEKLAASDVSIFIWGESGSGKEMLARAVHAASPRHVGPFVVVEAYSRDLTRFLDFHEALGRSFADATRLELLGFLNQQREQGLSSRSLARMLSSIKTFFYFLASERLIEKNPFFDMESPRIGEKLPCVLNRSGRADPCARGTMSCHGRIPDRGRPAWSFSWLPARMSNGLNP